MFICFNSCTVPHDGARRPSPARRRGKSSHPALPLGALRHQAAHAREHQLLHSHFRRRPPAIRPTQRAVSSGAAARCPVAPSSARQGAPAPAQPSPASPAGHQADAARLCIRRCRRCPEAPSSARQGAPAPALSFATAPANHQADAAHRALPPSAPRHQAAHAREHQLLHSRPRRRRPAIRPTQRAVSSGAAAQCPEAPSSARQGAPAPAQPSPAVPASHQADAARRAPALPDLTSKVGQAARAAKVLLHK